MPRACRRYNKCGVVASGVVALDRLVEVCLRVRLEKDPEVRLCEWSATTLTPKQLGYAVLDAEYSLRVFFYLLPLDNLTLRLGRGDAIAGVAVDVVPSHGSVAVMATRAARATIAEQGRWPTPLGCMPRTLTTTATRRIVTVAEVFAPSMIVPGVKNSKKERLTLGDLGDPPFSVMLPVAMLAPSSARRQSAPVRAGPAPGDAAAPGAAPDASPGAALDAAAGAAPGAAAGNAAAPAYGTVTPMLVDGAPDDDDDDIAMARAAQAAEATAAANAVRASVTPPAGDNGDDDAAAGYTGGGTCDGDHDSDAAELDVDEVRATRAAAAAAAAAIHGGTRTAVATPLDAPPSLPIRDMFSSVLGDNFHMMDRPKVPTHHSSKKGYFVALQEAL